MSRVLFVLCNSVAFQQHTKNSRCDVTVTIIIMKVKKDIKLELKLLIFPPSALSSRRCVSVVSYKTKYFLLYLSY